MSASLVGSEMCIRDRFSTKRFSAVTTQAFQWLGIKRHRTPTMSSIEPAAVSYTHLTLPTICSV
eukprot:11495159-Alexandrium_andersonii.AAC.1